MSKTMTKQEFKVWWEGLTDDDTYSMDTIADCAVDWGLYSRPRTSRIDEVEYAVLKAANVVDAEDFKPSDEDYWGKDE